MSTVPSDRAGWERLAATLRPQGRAVIAGRAQDAADGRTFDDVSPIDGRVIAPVARGGVPEVAAAVRAARDTFEAGTWRSFEPRARKQALRRFAEAIHADTPRLALLESLDVGKPIG
ncbi:MAG: aldehyde dehydrogenase family protein, partial [Methylobacteriaceae bacterium]|nr:aldehyde dehydrogenase family protein [Methylobacteriaceae bacterium]